MWSLPLIIHYVLPGYQEDDSGAGDGGGGTACVTITIC